MIYSRVAPTSRWLPWPTWRKWEDGKSITFQWDWNIWVNYVEWDLVYYTDGNAYYALVDNVWYQPDISPTKFSKFLDINSMSWVTISSSANINYNPTTNSIDFIIS